MMRRKLGILFLIGITVLAGTQEAAHQFDGLKSSLKNFTRASLWSGLIVYAQPVSDGKLPTPQIYYLMPAPQQRPVAPAAQQPVLADNGNGTTTTPRPEALNNHGGEAAAENTEAVALAATMREVEEGAHVEPVLHNLNKLPLHVIASQFIPPAPRVAPKPERVRVHEAERARVYEEVAKHDPLAARKFKQHTEALAKVFVRELDAVKLLAETERLMAQHEQLDQLKLKALAETANLHRRTEFRVVRRPARLERPERNRGVNPLAGTRGVATLPDMSSIGCEKPRVAPKAAPAPPPAAPVARVSAQDSGETVIGFELPLAPHTTGNTWTLNCDTEPEQK